MTKPDITSRADIEALVHAFYAQVMHDAEIGYIFTEVAKLNLDTHLPKISNFWEAVLLNKPVFQGNPMHKHFVLHTKSPLLPEHFNRWLTVWKATVDRLYAGETAERAKQRAESIATMMQLRFQELAQITVEKAE